uniref:Uncharacterized protein n=1 Tax=Cacopsylla melanoneura TaxID=428564 RepID=A0A8D8TVY7_9HEMI
MLYRGLKYDVQIYYLTLLFVHLYNICKCITKYVRGYVLTLYNSRLRYIQKYLPTFYKAPIYLPCISTKNVMKKIVRKCMEIGSRFVFLAILSILTREELEPISSEL